MYITTISTIYAYIIISNRTGFDVPPEIKSLVQRTLSYVRIKEKIIKDKCTCDSTNKKVMYKDIRKNAIIVLHRGSRVLKNIIIFTCRS